MKLIQTLLVAACVGLSFTAAAQWQWIDKDGHKVYSDRAPPAEIQDKNIIKRPGGNKIPAVAVSESATQTDGAPATAVPTGPASGAKNTGLDKELEAKKKQAQDAEAAKRKAAEQEVAKAKIENCVRAKQAKATYESAAPITRTNAAGVREVMDEAARAEEIRRIQGIMVRDCK